jgi:hypothetical protein
VLRFVFVVGFDRLCDVDAELAKLNSQGLPGDSQETGRLMLTSTGIFKDAVQEKSVELTMRGSVQVT